jgi:hypothetical protein
MNPKLAQPAARPSHAKTSEKSATFLSQIEHEWENNNLYCRPLLSGWSGKVPGSCQQHHDVLRMYDGAIGTNSCVTARNRHGSHLQLRKHIICTHPSSSSPPEPRLMQAPPYARTHSPTQSASSAYAGSSYAHPPTHTHSISVRCM